MNIYIAINFVTGVVLGTLYANNEEQAKRRAIEAFRCACSVGLQHTAAVEHKAAARRADVERTSHSFRQH